MERRRKLAMTVMIVMITEMILMTVMTIIVNILIFKIKVIIRMVLTVAMPYGDDNGGHHTDFGNHSDQNTLVNTRIIYF